MKLLLVLLSCMVFEKVQGIHNSVYVKDTCRLIKLPIDTLLREVTWYKEYYNKFKENDTSDYQLICISIPADDATGNVLYYQTSNGTGELDMGNVRNMKHGKLTGSRNKVLEQKIGESERGGYIKFCNLEDLNIIFSFCMVKRREEVVFQYQALNKNILDLSGEDAANLKKLIRIIRYLRT